MMVKKTRKRTPSIRARKAAANLAVNGGSKKQALLDAGFAPSVANNPKKVLDSKSFQDLVESYLPDVSVLGKHKALLSRAKLDHMTFPLGPVEDEEDDDVDLHIDETKDLALAERTTLTDKEIKQLLLEVDCIVRRIVHGQTARHVYFWSPDSKAQKEAIEMAYKIKGRLRFLGDGGGVGVAVQVNINEDRERFK